MFIGAFIVVACFIGVLFIYDYFVPMAGHKPAALEKKEQESIEATKKLIAQRKELEKRKKAEESKKRTHRLCQAWICAVNRLRRQ